MAQPPAPEKEPLISFLKLKVIYDGCQRPYLIRFSFIEFFGLSLKLHIILRSDDDRALHDHPWTFWTLMLSGGYWEETFPKQPGRACLEMRPGSTDRWGLTNINGHQIQTLKRWIKPGTFRICKAPYAHRLELDDDYYRRNGAVTPAATLVLMFPKTREWGFHTAKGWTKWLDFSPNRNDCE